VAGEDRRPVRGVGGMQLQLLVAELEPAGHGQALDLAQRER
jgi:hypothetical protein